MKVWEQIVYYAFVVGWIIAPFAVNEILKNRSIILPSDLRTYGILIWYGIGLAIGWWINRNKPNRSNKSNNPSYTDKGQNDWLNRN